jgi:hypothetical protein
MSVDEKHVMVGYDLTLLHHHREEEWLGLEHWHPTCFPSGCDQVGEIERKGDEGEIEKGSISI